MRIMFNLQHQFYVRESGSLSVPKSEEIQGFAKFFNFVWQPMIRSSLVVPDKLS